MKLPGSTFALILSLLLPTGLFAQESLTCVYLEGTAGFRDMSIEVGDELSGEGVLILDEESYVELVQGRRTLRLIGPGEYYLSDLARENSGASFAPSIGNRMRRLLRQDPEERFTTAGVRAEQARRDEWADLGPASELRAAAGEALEAGRPDAAEELYREALLYATENDSAIRLELAELLVARDRYDEAAELTSEISSEGFGANRMGRYFLARGAALFGLRSYDELIQLVTRSRQVELPAESTLYLELLAAEAYLARGDEQNARRSLRRVIAVGSDTPQAVAAKRFLGELSAD